MIIPATTIYLQIHLSNREVKPLPRAVAACLPDMGKLETRRVEDVLLRVPFGRYAVVTVSLPAFSLLYCFLTGIIFRFNDVNETVCKVGRVYCDAGFRCIFLVLVEISEKYRPEI